MTEYYEAPETTRVVFAVYREAAGPVFSSQVVGPVTWLATRGLAIQLLSFIPFGTWFRGAARRAFLVLKTQVRERLGSRAVWLPACPSRISSDPLAAWGLSGWLRWKCGRSPVVIHCRGASMTTLALGMRGRTKGSRVVFDCRGLAHAEYAYEQTIAGYSPEAWVVRRDQIREMEQRCARDADAVVCVSNAMARYLVDEFKIDSSRLRVVPCVVNTGVFAQALSARDAMRSELEFGDRLVVTYCGGLHSWQLPQESFRIFKLIRCFESRAHFFALTTQPDRMREMAMLAGLNQADITVLRVPHNEVPRYLVAGDIGLLMREISLVNAVASPVKFGEYLAAGLPVFLTEGIGDFSEVVHRDGLGLVFSLDDTKQDLLARLESFVGEYQRHMMLYRERCCRAAHRLLSPEVCYPTLVELYKELNEG